MKILLASNYINDRQNSMLLFARMLEKGLSDLGHDIRLTRPEPFFGRIIPSYKGLGKWLGYVDKFIISPRKLKKEIICADVVHICDHSNAHYSEYLKDVPSLVTCNDVLAIRSGARRISAESGKAEYLRRYILIRTIRKRLPA